MTKGCGANDWRRASVPRGFGWVPRGFGSVPRYTEALRHSLGHPYITRGLEVVDRILGASPVRCSPRHLTSHLFHSYISTAHSLRPQGLCFISFLCVCSRSIQATSLGFQDNERVISSRGKDRDSQGIVPASPS